MHMQNIFTSEVWSRGTFVMISKIDDIWYIDSEHYMAMYVSF